MVNKTPSLSFCILMDLIGMSSYLIPFFGEAIDFFWAPISAIVFFFLFGRKRFGTRGAAFSFIEEMLPGLDFMPTFTLAYLIKKGETFYSISILSN